MYALTSIVSSLFSQLAFTRHVSSWLDNTPPSYNYFIKRSNTMFNTIINLSIFLKLYTQDTWNFFSDDLSINIHSTYGSLLVSLNLHFEYSILNLNPLVYRFCLQTSSLSLTSSRVRSIPIMSLAKKHTQSQLLP